MQISRLFFGTAFVLCTGILLWVGKPFLVPISYALLTALVVYPFCTFLESKGMGKTLSIVLPILGVCILFAGLVALLSFETAILGGKWPLLEKQIDPFVDNVHKQLESTFGWSTLEQDAWLRSKLDQLSERAAAFLTETLRTFFETLFQLIIIPVYVALFLAYRSRLAGFLIEILPESYRSHLPYVLNETVNIFSQYIRGLIVVYLVVGILNTLGLWAIGLENPLLFGMFTAIMTIIPYFGIILSALLPITLSWLHTGSIWQPIGIVVVFSIVQYLEANLIFPYVVGRYVKLNTLAAILSIFLGALFWGVSGMILFLPVLAVFRIFAANFPDLKPWAKLLGSD